MERTYLPEPMKSIGHIDRIFCGVIGRPLW